MISQVIEVSGSDFDEGKDQAVIVTFDPFNRKDRKPEEPLDVIKEPLDVIQYEIYEMTEPPLIDAQTVICIHQNLHP